MNRPTTSICRQIPALIAALVIILFTLAAQTSVAQTTQPARGGRGRGGVEDSVVRGAISPVVSDDHRITFHLTAPNAKQVQVRGDFTIHMSTILDMTKDDKGVWSYTTEPLKPSSYQYWFIMDGLILP